LSKVEIAFSKREASENVSPDFRRTEISRTRALPHRWPISTEGHLDDLHSPKPQSGVRIAVPSVHPAVTSATRRRAASRRTRGPVMPKKMGVNSKAEAARDRRSAAEADRRDRQERAKEEQYWAEAEGPKSRAARRREEDAEKRAEAAARKAENRRLAEAEAAAVAASASAPSKAAARKASRVAAPPPKVTEAELVRLREEERLRLEREAEAAKKRAARVAEEEEYERVVLVENTNRDDSLIEARSVEEAIARMSVVDPQASLPADKHPERRLKSTFKVYYNFTKFCFLCSFTKQLSGYVKFRSIVPQLQIK
jgi:hypothetical protein